MNNDKKMPNQNQNQKPGNKPDMDEKQPQSDRGIGKEHGVEQKDKQSSSVKPGFDKENSAGKQPQSSRVSQSSSSDLDSESDIDQDDNQVTQRSNRQASEPSKGK